MKKELKRVMAIVMTMCLMIASFSTASADDYEIMPLYNNTVSTLTNMSINSSGKMTITYKYTGISGTTTKAVITTYIEKRTLGIFWSRVDIGTTDDEWVDTISKTSYTGSRTYQLSSSGTYRVNVEYKIYGSGGSADTINYQGTDSY